MSRRKRLQEEGIEDGAVDSVDEATEVSESVAVSEEAATALIPLINSLLPGEVHLPTDTTGETLIPNLKTVLEVLQSINGEGVIAEDATEEALDSVAIESMPLAAQLAIKGYRRILRRQREEQRKQAQIEYTSRLDQLCRRGAIDGSEREGLMRAGELARFSLAILSPYERFAAPTNGVAKTQRLALAASDGKGETYAERRNRTLRAFGIPTKN